MADELNFFFFLKNKYYNYVHKSFSLTKTKRLQDINTVPSRDIFM